MLVERVMVQPLYRHLFKCHMRRSVEEDLRKRFPNTTVEYYDLPSVLQSMRPQINAVCVKD